MSSAWALQPASTTSKPSELRLRSRIARLGRGRGRRGGGPRAYLHGTDPGRGARPVVLSARCVTIAPQPADRATELARRCSAPGQQQRVRPHLHRLRTAVVAVDAAFEGEADAAVDLVHVRGHLAAGTPGPREHVTREARPPGRQRTRRTAARPSRASAASARRACTAGRAASGAPNCSRRSGVLDCLLERPVGKPGEVGERHGAPRVKPSRDRTGTPHRLPERAACRRASARAPHPRPVPRRGARAHRSRAAPQRRLVDETERRDGASELDPAGNGRAEQVRIHPELGPARPRRVAPRDRRRDRPATRRRPARAVPPTPPGHRAPTPRTAPAPARS